MRVLQDQKFNTQLSVFTSSTNFRAAPLQPEQREHLKGFSEQGCSVEHEQANSVQLLRVGIKRHGSEAACASWTQAVYKPAS